MNKLFTSIILCAVCLGCSIQPKSPNGKISMQTDGEQICIMYDGQPVLDIASVGIRTSATGEGMTFHGISKTGRISEEYQMLAGKTLSCSNEANEYVLKYTDKNGKPVRLVFRLYNDGIAFRYELSDLDGETLVDENTVYHIPEGTGRWIQRWTEPYEEFFPYSTTGTGACSASR